MLPSEQIPKIKEQLLEQIGHSNLPNKEELKKSIELMNPEQLEEFLVQNKLIKPEEENSEEENQKCIFCSIVEGKIPTNKIDENKDSIAVLEINPISKGHSIILPKEHFSESSKIPQTAFSLAKKISKKMKTKFKVKNVLISSSNVFGHEIINVIPIYKNETLASPRSQAKPEELEQLKKLLEKKTKPKVIKKSQPKEIKEKLWLPKRIP